MSYEDEWYNPDAKGPFSEEEQYEKLQTARFLIARVLEQTPDIYWKFAKSHLTFPTVIVRIPFHFKIQMERFRVEGVIPKGKGRTRDPYSEYNLAVSLAHDELLTHKLNFLTEKLFSDDPLPEYKKQIASLPDISSNTVSQWEGPLLAVFMAFHNRNPEQDKYLRKKAKDSLKGKNVSPSDSDIRAEIRSEFKKAIKRFAKERDDILRKD